MHEYKSVKPVGLIKSDDAVEHNGKHLTCCLCMQTHSGLGRACAMDRIPQVSKSLQIIYYKAKYRRFYMIE